MSVTVAFDTAPVRQSFGACNVVFDGVATRNGTQYRVNVTATRGGRNPDVMLRYLTPAKSGQAVPETMLADVRAAVVAAAVEHLAPYRAAYVAECRARDEAAAPVQHGSHYWQSGSLRTGRVDEHCRDCSAAHDDDAAALPCPNAGNRSGAAPLLDTMAAAQSDAAAAADEVAADMGFGTETVSATPVVIETTPAPFLSIAHVEATRARMAAEDEADRVVVVANTTRAVYWRNANGYVAAGPDVRAEAVATMGGYARLDSLMLLKGEASDTIARLCGPGGLPRANPAPRLSYPISYRWPHSEQRHHTTTSGDSMEGALAAFKRDNPGTISHCITHPDHA